MVSSVNLVSSVLFVLIVAVSGVHVEWEQFKNKHGRAFRSADEEVRTKASKLFCTKHELHILSIERTIIMNLKSILLDQ
jgi:hypothetical protein